MANFLPRLCFHPTSSGDILSGNGPFVDVIRSGSILRRISLFAEDCNHVFGIVPTTNEDVFVFGERSLAYLSSSYLDVSSMKKLDPSCVTHFPDTVMQAKVLDNDKIVLLFTCNTTVLYNFSFSETKGLELKEEERVQSAHTAVMLKGLLLGNDWNNLITIVGTVFGEILVSRPGKSSEVVHKYEGHTGMIFGLCLWQNFLLSISDDRSLRVWSFDENFLKSGVELACEYGHSARPFAIIENENKIYTAGVDRTVCVWTFEAATKSLKICDRFTLNIGGIRSLAYHENHLWCGSETGGLLGVRTARPSDGLALDHCDDLRGFALEHDNLYTVDGSGTLYRNGTSVLSSEGLKLRYLVASPSFYTAQAVVAYGEKNAVVFAEGSEVNLTCDFRILSAICTATHVLLYAVNKKAYLYTVSGLFICVISAEKALSGIHKKTSLIPSAMLLLSESENSHTLIIGSSSGQMLFCDLNLDASKKDDEFQFATDSKVNREFGGDYVMSLRSINDDVIMGLGKNGKITCWRVGSKDGVSFLSLLSSSFVSSSVPLDWPCSIVILNGKEYITGFHSTTFHLIDSQSGLSVISCEIGGGNRAWQFRWNEEEQRATLYWIRHQRLSSISYQLADFLSASPSLHLSQIVFVRVIFPSEGTNDVIVCTGSIDNHIVFSGYDSDTEEWTILWRQSSDVCFICMTSDSLSSPSGDNSVIAVTGGGKGLLTAWQVSRRDLCSRASSFLSPLCKLAQYEHLACTRVVDVDMYKTNVDEFGVMAAHADGSIDLYSISSESTQFTVLSTIQPPDYSLFSKVSISRFDDFITASAISTSGRLSRFKVEEEKLEKIEELPVARCGLSAVATYRIPEDYSIPACILTAVGDESGEVAICVTSSDRTEHICTVKYHCATVTDLSWSVQNGDISILSTSLDCQLVQHLIDLREKKATFVRAIPLAIWDPSSFVVDRSDVIAVGSGLECVKWE